MNNSKIDKVIMINIYILVSRNLCWLFKYFLEFGNRVLCKYDSNFMFVRDS